MDMRQYLLFVGGIGGTNVGESLLQAAHAAGKRAEIMNSGEAMSQHRLLQRVFWHVGGRRPVFLTRFGKQAVAKCKDQNLTILIATGSAPLTRAALERLKASGVTCLNYSTDDPFNPAHRAPWHLEALPAYNIVFTPRRSNVEDLRGLGCSDVRYLPFGYDERLFGVVPKAPPAATNNDVLFVGGADSDRAEFFSEFLKHGPRPTLVGSYWERYEKLRDLSVGQKSAAELRDMTASAAINICLVRRANRDGHVMRSYEIPACGGFMIAEDTQEHREIFGKEGDYVLYFASPEEAAKKSHLALADPDGRRRMAAATHERITRHANTYRHRLDQMLSAMFP